MCTYQQRTAHCCFWPRPWAKNDDFRGRLFVLTVISLYLTARSAAAGLFAVGDGGVELFEPDPGGAVGGGAPIADRLRGMVISRRSRRCGGGAGQPRDLCQ